MKYICILLVVYLIKKTMFVYKSFNNKYSPITILLAVGNQRTNCILQTHPTDCESRAGVTLLFASTLGNCPSTCDDGKCVTFVNWLGSPNMARQQHRYLW